MLIEIFFFVNLLAMSLTEREHKVHNIILFPEKNSWCRTTPIEQVVSSPGYESVTIDNNICVGACFSYSIPSTQPAEPGELIRPYCDSCQPAESKCYHVTLHADSTNVDGPRTFQKLVQIILNCSCMSCEKFQQEDCDISTHNNTLELPLDLFSNRNEDSKAEEVPELLHFPSSKQRPRPSVAFGQKKQKQNYQLNSKLINLLKSIQNEEDEDSNISYDKGQLKELLKIIEGSENKLSDTNLMEFVNFVNINNSEDLEVDLSKLKEVLSNFQKTQNQQNNADIERDLKKYGLPSNFGVEGVIPAPSEIDSGENRAGHHHLGEEVHVGVGVAHHVKGPHGSMVLAPNLKVEEKLNIYSDHLKPNEDGTVISYENHHQKPNILTD